MLSMALVLPARALPTAIRTAPSPSPASAYQTFSEEIERDLPLKRKTPLYLQHHLGKVSIQGWVQDRIRVKLKKRILAQDETQAQAELKKVDLITLETADSFEMRVGHSRGSDLVSKLRDEKQSQVVVDLEIKAPYQMDLTIVLGEEKDLSLDQWKGAVFLTGKNSALTFTRLNLQKAMRLNCQNCAVQMSDSKTTGHILAGSRNVVLRNVESGGEMFVDSGAGEVRLEETRGKMIVHTKSGRLNSYGHHGDLTFQSEDGGLFVTGLKGNLEAQTQSGQFMVEVDEVSEFLRLDTEKSDVQITLPTKFEGALDLLSLRGEVVVQFPVESKKQASSEFYGPASPGRIDATIGNSTDVTIHAYSKQGGVRILRKVPKR
jgi:hypothetical protein